MAHMSAWITSMPGTCLRASSSMRCERSTPVTDQPREAECRAKGSPAPPCRRSRRAIRLRRRLVFEVATLSGVLLFAAGLARQHERFDDKFAPTL